MVNSLVERATSDMLIGPDWAMNIEISDMLNRDPGQVKDIVKGIKRRIGSKNPKVQLLALTLLETIIKNSGDIVHMQVAEKNVLHEMVKIVKKKPDYQVKEKILVLIDTWQEAFGGPRARYPQYYAAYQELLRSGAVFPQRSERVAPIFTPPQSHPLSSYPQNVQDSAFSHDDTRPESSAEAEYPTLSLSEMQNARGSMDVLAEMLNAIDPGNKEGLRQEALVDLVEQCRTYKQRVVHLVNSTMDESLLSQGLALNDDLQRVLAKYESIISGASAEADKSKPEPAIRDLVAVDIGESSKQTNERSTLGANTSTTLVPVSAPPAANSSTLAPKADPKMDLLSGDLLGGDFDSSPAQNSLALVPVSAPQPASPVAFGNNALALVDMFSEGSSARTLSNGPPPFSTGSEIQKQPHLYSQQPSLYQNGTPSNIGSSYEQSAIPQVPTPFSTGSEFQKQPHLYSQQPSLYQNGMPSNIGSPYEHSAIPQVPTSAWSAQSAQPQQQPSSPAYGTQNGSSLPPPPWESQPTETQTLDSPNPPTMQVSTTAVNEQIPGMFMQQPVTNQSYQMPIYPQHMQGGQMPGFIPQPMQPTQMTSMYPQPTYGNQMGGYGNQMCGYGNQMGAYGNQMGAYGNQMAGYGNEMAGYGYGGYGHQQDAQYLEQRMYGLSVKDDSASSRTSMASYLPPMKKQSNGDDKLFGDLVDMAKIKPTKTTPPGRAGSM